MKLIGLTGKKRCGKDTFAHYICDKYGYKQYAFAQPLKQACREIFLLNDEQVDGTQKETPIDRLNGITPRQIFQKVGTEIFRDYIGVVFPELKEFNNNFWTKRFEWWIEEQQRECSNCLIVISDVRFDNEAELIKKYGGIIIEIDRHTGLQDGHISEKGISRERINYQITNNNSITNYHGEIDKIIEML
jgi:hypothetical protein